MKIVQFLLDYIDPSPAKKREEQAKQYIIGIKNRRSTFTKNLFIGLFVRHSQFEKIRERVPSQSRDAMAHRSHSSQLPFYNRLLKRQIPKT
jgi:hypothetical protein